MSKCQIVGNLMPWLIYLLTKIVFVLANRLRPDAALCSISSDKPIVDILSFISRINTTSERLVARNFFICLYFSFYEQLKFRAQLS